MEGRREPCPFGDLSVHSKEAESLCLQTLFTRWKRERPDKESDAHSTHPALHFYIFSDTVYHRLILKFFLHKADWEASQRLLSTRACKNLGRDNEIVNRNTLESICFLEESPKPTVARGIYIKSHGQNSVSFLQQLPGLRVPTMG